MPLSNSAALTSPLRYEMNALEGNKGPRWNENIIPRDFAFCAFFFVKNVMVFTEWRLFIRKFIYSFSLSLAFLFYEKMQPRNAK